MARCRPDAEPLGRKGRDGRPAEAERLLKQVRGRDLVATYDETGTRPFRVTLYWRALDRQTAPGALLGVELIVSGDAINPTTLAQP